MTMQRFLSVILFILSPLFIPLIIWLAGFAMGNIKIQTIGRRIGKWLGALIAGLLIYCAAINLLLLIYGRTDDNTELQLFSLFLVAPIYILTLIGLNRRGIINFK